MTGTKRERSPGHWQLRVYVGKDSRGRPIQVSRSFSGGVRAAGKALANLVAEVDAQKLHPSTVTVGQLLDRWLEHSEPRRSVTTMIGYRRKIEHALRPAFGSIRLGRLRADVIDARYREWLDSGLSPTTVRQYHAILSAALNQAVKWGWIAENVAVRTSPPSARRVQLAVPTPKEIQAIIARAERRDETLATAVALAALTGARRGEICALRWTDVTLGVLTISRSISVVGKKVHEGGTKTHQARVIALDETGQEVLSRRRLEALDLAGHVGTDLAADAFVLSPRGDGRAPMLPDTLSHRFAALMKDMGLPYHFHDLRHFAATQMVAAGTDLRTVAGRLGHADPSMTLRVYAHALPERDREAAELLGRVLMPPPQG